jgi:hypothetical protein
VYHTSRNCFASIRTYNTRLSTRIANRTHARKRAVSGLVIQITIVGADRELKDFQNLIKSQHFQNQVINVLVNDNSTWKFLPPRAPHFGGLHEAAVKSMKYHLKCITKNVTFNF